MSLHKAFKPLLLIIFVIAVALGVTYYQVSEAMGPCHHHDGLGEHCHETLLP